MGEHQHVHHNKAGAAVDHPVPAHGAGNKGKHEIAGVGVFKGGIVHHRKAQGLSQKPGQQREHKHRHKAAQQGNPHARQLVRAELILKSVQHGAGCEKIQGEAGEDLAILILENVKAHRYEAQNDHHRQRADLLEQGQR